MGVLNIKGTEVLVFVNEVGLVLRDFLSSGVVFGNSIWILTGLAIPDVNDTKGRVLVHSKN